MTIYNSSIFVGRWSHAAFAFFWVETFVGGAWSEAMQLLAEVDRSHQNAET